MERAIVTRGDGRKYVVLVEGENEILIGPPEGLVDNFGLSEETATRLHNILLERELLNYKIISARTKDVFGALQEALSIDVQRLVEAYHRYES